MYDAYLMTLNMSWEMLIEIHGCLDDSFVITDTWKKIKKEMNPEAK